MKQSAILLFQMMSISSILLMILIIISSSSSSSSSTNSFFFCNALMNRVSNLTFTNQSHNMFFSTSIISPSTVADTSAFAVFATYTQPSRLVRISIPSKTSSPPYLTNNSFTTNLTLNAGEDYVRCSVISPDGALGFFGTESSPTSYIIKIDLSASNALTRIGRLALTVASQTLLWSAVMTPNGVNSLWGTWQSPGTIIKIRNADLFQESTITLGAGENKLQSACITPDGVTALFGCWTGSPAGIIVKINVASFTRVSSLTLNSGENYPVSAVMSADGSYALFGTDTSDVGRIVKIDVATLTRVQGISVAGTARLASAVISADGAHAYFGSATAPGVVAQIALADPTSPNQIFVESTTTLNSGENYLWTAVSGKNLGANSDYTFFAAYTQPASIVQVFTAVTTTTTTTTTSTTTTTGAILGPTVSLQPWTATTTTAIPGLNLTTGNSTAASSSALTTSQTIGLIVGVVLAFVIFMLLLVCLFIPWCKGQPGFCCAMDGSVKNATICADDSEAVQPQGEPHFHHQHIQAKLREMKYVEEESQRRGGVYFYPADGYDETVFYIADESPTSRSTNYKLTPAMRKKLRLIENSPSSGTAKTRNNFEEYDENNNNTNHYESGEDKNQEGEEENFDTFAKNSPNAHRRDSISPVRNNQNNQRMAWTRGVDAPDNNDNLQQHQQQNNGRQNSQQGAFFYRSPANFRNNNANGSPSTMISSVERQRQLQDYYNHQNRNDENTSYYFNNASSVDGGNDNKNRLSPQRLPVVVNDQNNNNNQLPLSYAHRSPFPFARQNNGGFHNNSSDFHTHHMERNNANGTVSNLAWSTPSGRTYGAERSPTRRNNYNNEDYQRHFPAFTHVDRAEQQQQQQERSRSEEMAPLPHYSYGRNENEQDRRQNYYNHPSEQQQPTTSTMIPAAIHHSENNARASALRGRSNSPSTSSNYYVNRYSPSTFQQRQQYGNDDDNKNDQGYYSPQTRKNYVSPSMTRQLY